jgi:glycosyl hydrolase family 16
MRIASLFSVLLFALFADYWALCQSLPQLPKVPVRIAEGTNWCDTTPYKLVFYDEFTGYLDKSGNYPGVYHPVALDVDKWYVPVDTLGSLPAPVSALNMAANDGSGNCILSVEKVSNIVKHGRVPATDTTWNTDGSYILDTLYNDTYYAAELGSTGFTAGEFFMEGKFEACISMPGFFFSHSNMFLVSWGSEPTGANIDISACEAYGDPIGTFGPDWGLSGHRHIEGSAANWWVSNGVALPGGGALPYFSNQRFGGIWPLPSYYYYANLFDSYHIYTFEWDENMLTWSIDYKVVRQMPRWHKKSYKGRSYSGCQPPAGEYQEDPAFPDEKYGFPVHIIFHTWPDRAATGDAHKSGRLGSMKINWIRVYQKHLDKWHHDLCDRKLDISPVGDKSTFKVTLTGAGAMSTGDSVRWTTSSNLSIANLPGNPSWTNVILQKTAPGSNIWVRYTDNNPVCPSIVIYRSY